MNISDKAKAIFLKELDIQSDKMSVNKLGGLTNYNYQINVDNDSYVLRLPGNGTENLINRHDEFVVTKMTNELDIDAESLFFDPITGIKITKYIAGAVTMNEDLVKDVKNMEAIAELLNRLHKSNKSIPVNFDVFDKIEEYESLINEEYKYYWDDYNDIRRIVLSMKKEYTQTNTERVLCHNDPLCENFILGSERLYLVDWEYAGMNDPMWDIADIFIEANFSEKDEELFKKLYFGRPADEYENRRILMNKILLDFLWSLWAKQRCTCGEELQEYANIRYKRSKENLKNIIKYDSN